MKKYRKRPIVVEAIQITQENIQELVDLGIFVAVANGVNTEQPEGTLLWVEVDTPEGTMRSHEGAYIIKGIMGEFYPCEQEIFELTYDQIS